MEEMVLMALLQEVGIGSVATGTDTKKSLKDLKISMDSSAFLTLFSGRGILHIKISKALFQLSITDL